MKEWLWGKYFFTDEQKKIDLLLKHEFDWNFGSLKLITHLGAGDHSLRLLDEVGR